MIRRVVVIGVFMAMVIGARFPPNLLVITVAITIAMIVTSCISIVSPPPHHQHNALHDEKYRHSHQHRRPRDHDNHHRQAPNFPTMPVNTFSRVWSAWLSAPWLCSCCRYSYHPGRKHCGLCCCSSFKVRFSFPALIIVVVMMLATSTTRHQYHRSLLVVFVRHGV